MSLSDLIRFAGRWEFLYGLQEPYSSGVEGEDDQVHAVLQSQLEETTKIVTQAAEKVLERGLLLDDVMERALNLEVNARPQNVSLFDYLCWFYLMIMIVKWIE